MSEADKYETLEKIGHGSFGIIRKVRRKSDGIVLCRKEISYIRMSQKEKEQLHAEYSILHSLNHPNIVAYYQREHFKSSQDLHLYMEYCGNGDLGRTIKTLKAKNQCADEEFVWSIFSQLVTALYRCHYGVDPPEIGGNVMGVGNNAKPRVDGGKVMILHRDLKPENVFLGEDNSVKLGDFGLSKIMQSHDFASTYVGTPFYMSPEICAAERYTLKSDIWSLGCIIYELCVREPPFNARSHLELVVKIKRGKRDRELPKVYSPELANVISSCLKVNPYDRPDTAALLNLPVVKLMRKEREVVELGKLLKAKEETLAQRLQEAEAKLCHARENREKDRRDMECSVRREWEVKARLEIDRQVKAEIDRRLETELLSLSRRFDAEVQAKVTAELNRHQLTIQDQKENVAPRDDIHLSSVSTSGDLDFPSTTDLTSLSLESPLSQKALPPLPRKGMRTPFARSKTTYIESPMDIHMAEPSPISIASLSLSPRRNARGVPGQTTEQHLFAAATGQDAHNRWRSTNACSPDGSDGEDDEPLPSPTRQKPSSRNPFKIPARPLLPRQETVPLNKTASQVSIFGTTTATKPDLRPTAPAAEAKKLSTSPNRRLSKIPSSTHLHGIGPTQESGSPIRRCKSSKALLNTTTNTALTGVKSKQIGMQGRTLVELAQARGGGAGGSAELAQARAGGRPVSSYGEERDKTLGFAARMAEKAEAPMWDPERDEMPSPFIVRSVRGGVGMGRRF